MAEKNKISKENEEVALQIEGELATILLGGESESVVILTEQRLRSFQQAINTVAKDRKVKGLVVFGGSESIFCAGADISAINGISDPKLGEELARAGQEVFDSLAALECTTVAAICGACVGGGCELVLACDYRIAVDVSKTRIGLPEIKLGILPGFGGTQRLPRLIGLPKALDIILQGKVVSAKRAHKLGLVDRLISLDSVDARGKTAFQVLEDAANAIAVGNDRIETPALSLVDQFLTKTLPGRKIVAHNAKKAVLKETKGNYPCAAESTRCYN